MGYQKSPATTDALHLTPVPVLPEPLLWATNLFIWDLQQMCFGITCQTSQVSFHWNTRIHDSETVVYLLISGVLLHWLLTMSQFLLQTSLSFLSLSIQHTFFPPEPSISRMLSNTLHLITFWSSHLSSKQTVICFLGDCPKEAKPSGESHRTGQISGTTASSHQPQWAPHCPSILLDHLLWYHPTPYNDYFKPSAFSKPPAKSSFTSLPFNRYAELQLFRENQISQMGTTSTFTLFHQIYLYTYPSCLLLLPFWGPNPSIVLLVSSPPLPSTSKETYYKFPLLSGVYSTMPWTLYPIFKYGAALAECNKKYIHFPTTPYLFFLTFLLEGFIYTVYCLLPFLFKLQAIPVKIQPPSPWIWKLPQSPVNFHEVKSNECFLVLFLLVLTKP